MLQLSTIEGFGTWEHYVFNNCTLFLFTFQNLYTNVKNIIKADYSVKFWLAKSWDLLSNGMSQLQLTCIHEKIQNFSLKSSFSDLSPSSEKKSSPTISNYWQ